MSKALSGLIGLVLGITLCAGARADWWSHDVPVNPYSDHAYGMRQLDRLNDLRHRRRMEDYAIENNRLQRQQAEDLWWNGYYQRQQRRNEQWERDMMRY